ncbi:hypothetical protein [Streptomyces diastatochromogenes]|uniref:hypothetical protein n=1 Tax=Streptomyces diastatochromogenes TaxID=42236 RepID=UPI0036C83758
MPIPMPVEPIGCQSCQLPCHHALWTSPSVPTANRSIWSELRLWAAMTVPGAVTGLPVPPRTSLLRQGLDQGHQYYVNEEEVPQTGTRLSLAYNRARRRDGRVSVRLSARRGIGRGEGSSGLAFDFLVDTTGTGGAGSP